jgi:lipid-A-disaccharide synthase-like uncharacterized protein
VSVQSLSELRHYQVSGCTVDLLRHTADRTISHSDYVKEQNLIEGLHSSARVHNDDFVGIASYNIFVGIYVATIFGSGFFFDLFWPERHETKSVRFAWKVCSVLACIMCLADALAITVIVARNSSTITANTADQMAIAEMVINPPLGMSFLQIELRREDVLTSDPVYRHNARAVASVVLLWPGWVCGLPTPTSYVLTHRTQVATVASTCILFASHFHDDVYGPKTAHVRRQEEKDVEAPSVNAETPVSTPPRDEPSPAPPARLSKLSAYKSGRWHADR